ncbi:MAG: hypothetical protein H0U73_10460 [Tatlockia sp.]|nr:hypothetical protein [Tatlockia sp.]
MRYKKNLRLSQKIVPIVYLFLSFLTCEAFSEPESQAVKFNQIIGTQDFAPLYGCSGQCSVIEAARNISELGSRIIKMRTTDAEALKAVLDMPFDSYFFWWRSNGDTWLNGFSKEARKVEYDETYKFAKTLLIQFKDSEKRFFLGNWEGDWYPGQDHECLVINPIV